jgi:hypothetical protein
MSYERFAFLGKPCFVPCAGHTSRVPHAASQSGSCIRPVTPASIAGPLAMRSIR